MKIYYDCEFLEGKQDKRFLGFKYGTTKPTIDLISIGLVAEDGREYYAISKDFNLKEAWNRYDTEIEQVSGDMRNIFPEGIKNKVYWIRENVLKPIFRYWLYSGHVNAKLPFIELNEIQFTYKNFKKFLNHYGQTNKQIAEEVMEFCKPSIEFEIIKPITVSYTEIKNPVLYGYYSAYDHVCLSWLFGKMIDLPKSFPMYTKDLKQIFDEKADKYSDHLSYGKETLQTKIDRIKNKSDYPQQKDEHNALYDARWNQKLHEFLNTL